MEKVTTKHNITNLETNSTTLFNNLSHLQFYAILFHNKTNKFVKFISNRRRNFQNEGKIFKWTNKNFTKKKKC